MMTNNADALINSKELALIGIKEISSISLEAINSHHNDKMIINQIVTVSIHVIRYTHRNELLLHGKLNGTCEHQKLRNCLKPTFRLLTRQ